MFFRLKTTKTTPVLQLVETFRNSEGQPRQRILHSFGNLNIPKHLWRDVAREIDARLKQSPLLFPPHPQVAAWADRLMVEIERKDPAPDPEAKDQLWCEVIPEKITHHHTTRLGPELVVQQAWEQLSFGPILRELGFNPTEIRDSAISIFNRLLDPCSDHALPDWVSKTSLPDLFRQRLDGLSDDRFYRISDRLHDHRDALEQKLAQQEASLFNLKRTIYLCDLTNTYFEGLCSRNENAVRTGNSKHKRSDAPHVAFGMVLDGQGFAIRHRTFAGNTHDSKALMEMVKQLQGDGPRPLVIMDSGMSSEENLGALKAAGMDYLTVQKRPCRLAYQEWFADLSQFQTVPGRKGKPDVNVITRDQEDERLVCCYSKARAAKEEAILSKAEIRLLADLEKLKNRILNGRLKMPEKIQQAIGRLRERHPRIARYYRITYRPTSQKLVYTRHDADYQIAAQATGGYILRTNRKDLQADEIWRLYIMLTRVESGFRALKTDLGLRPIFHHTPKRCDGHIFITVLAYHLLHWIEYSLRLHGMTASWPTIRRLLSTHAYTTIVLTTRHGQAHHLRKAGLPDTQQRRIYELLGINYKTLPVYHTISP